MVVIKIKLKTVLMQEFKNENEQKSTNKNSMAHLNNKHRVQYTYHYVIFS